MGGPVAFAARRPWYPIFDALFLEAALDVAALHFAELFELFDGLEIAPAEVGVVAHEVGEVFGVVLHDLAEQLCVGAGGLAGVA